MWFADRLAKATFKGKEKCLSSALNKRFFSFTNQALQKPFIVDVVFQTETMETQPPRRLSVCFVVRKPDRFKSPFALMLGVFPLQHHYFGIRHQHQPFKSNVFTAITICMPVQREHIFFCLSVYYGGGLNNRLCRDEVYVCVFVWLSNYH